MAARHFALARIAGVAVFFASGSAAWADTACNGALTGTVSGDVVVPKGASCTLSQVNVNGSVQVSSGASLSIDGRQYPSVINGDVEAEHCVSVLLNGAVTVGGEVHIQ